ncbi:MAG TPA: alpha/beta hydrolase [Stellaceae bacterium]|jgi:acetyl esterase/lipase|nr:alpha/beta hydrolase [Stellaceae bacterium]
MIDRRTLLLSAASLGFSAGIARAQTRTTTTVTETRTVTIGPPIPLTPPPPVPPPRPIHIDTENVLLWPSMPPSGGGPLSTAHADAHGAVSDVSVPTLTVYHPPNPNGTVVIIAAGGGYRRIEIGLEARPVAMWLAAQGITACVLTYRLPPEDWGCGIFAPFQDAQRAVRLVRGTNIGVAKPPVASSVSQGAAVHGGASQGNPSRGMASPAAARPVTGPKRVGVMGFSAGGHLMGMASAQWATDLYPPQDGLDTITARPDFAALIYPIITLRPPYNDTETRRILLGDHPTAEESAGWSVEPHVKDDCPPVFLVHAADDKVAPPENSVIMAAACRRVAVPVERLLLPSGGHAFGLGHPGTPSATWPAQFLAWQAKA